MNIESRKPYNTNLQPKMVLNTGNASNNFVVEHVPLPFYSQSTFIICERNIYTPAYSQIEGLYLIILTWCFICTYFCCRQRKRLWLWVWEGRFVPLTLQYLYQWSMDKGEMKMIKRIRETAKTYHVPTFHR